MRPDPKSVISLEDPAALRALTHPLRQQILGRLRLNGAATASELARELGESSGSTSYHLRQLARYGFVVDDENPANKRDRRWRAAHAYTSIGQRLLEGAVGEQFQSQRIHDLLESVDHVREVQRTDPAWESAGLSDLRVRLTPEALQRWTEQIVELAHALETEHAPMIAIHVHTGPAVS